MTRAERERAHIVSRLQSIGAIEHANSALASAQYALDESSLDDTERDYLVKLLMGDVALWALNHELPSDQLEALLTITYGSWFGMLSEQPT